MNGWPTACVFCGRPIDGDHPRVGERYCSGSCWRRQEYALKRLRDTSPLEALDEAPDASRKQPA
jgi:predicted nucleic acid-binding Zn ribbon protein